MSDITNPEAKIALPVVLTVKAISNVEVFVSGTFNNWSAEDTPLIETAERGIYRCVLMLAPGTYEYKFYINRIWFVDPENPDFIQNDFGTLNSVLRVR